MLLLRLLGDRVGTYLRGGEAFDPPTFVAVPLILLAVALLANAIPALRATQVDPLQALRAE